MTLQNPSPSPSLPTFLLPLIPLSSSPSLLPFFHPFSLPPPSLPHPSLLLTLHPSSLPLSLTPPPSLSLSDAFLSIQSVLTNSTDRQLHKVRVLYLVTMVVNMNNMREVLSVGCSHTSCITSLSFHGGWEKNILLEHGAKDDLSLGFKWLSTVTNVNAVFFTM